MGYYRIVLADDNSFFRRALKKVIDQDPDLRVVGEANDGLQLLRLLDRNSSRLPQMVLLDISMPNLNGIQTLQKMKSQYPTIKVLILTIHKEAELFYQSMSAGAMGYLLKDEVGANLFQAIEMIRKEKTYVSPLLLKDLENGFKPSVFEDG